MVEKFIFSEDKMLLLKDSQINFNPSSIAEANLILASIEVKRAQTKFNLANYPHDTPIEKISKARHFLVVLKKAEITLKACIVSLVKESTPSIDEYVIGEALVKVNATSLKQYFGDNAGLISLLEIKDVCKWENGIPSGVSVYKLIGDDLYFVIDGTPNDRYALTIPPYHFESYEDFVTLSDSINMSKTKIFFANPMI